MKTVQINSFSVAKAVEALGFPSTFKALITAEGAINKVFTKIASLHSGVGGVNGAHIKITHDAAQEISEEEFKILAAQMFGIR